MSNNKRRLLTLIKVLTKESDNKHPLSEIELKALLSKDDLEIKNRKTIYEDIQVLNDFGYEVIYDTKQKGYYLENAPFSLPELKILIDEINELKDFDSKDLTSKLLSFASNNQEKQLTSINKNKKIKKTNISYLNKIDIILKAIENAEYLIINYNNKDNTICPYYLHLSNNKYYLYLTYKDSSSIYSYRLDRIKDIKNNDEHFEVNERIFELIKKNIKTSYDNFNKNDAELISLSCVNYETLSKRLDDDFPEHYLDNKGNIIVEYQPNEIFFSKLVSYGTNLKIEKPVEIKKAYIDYLKDICDSYKKVS